MSQAIIVFLSKPSFATMLYTPCQLRGRWSRSDSFKPVCEVNIRTIAVSRLQVRRKGANEGHCCWPTCASSLRPFFSPRPDFIGNAGARKVDKAHVHHALRTHLHLIAGKFSTSGSIPLLEAHRFLSYVNVALRREDTQVPEPPITRYRLLE